MCEYPSGKNQQATIETLYHGTQMWSWVSWVWCTQLCHIHRGSDLLVYDGVLLLDDVVCGRLDGVQSVRVSQQTEAGRLTSDGRTW